MQGSFLSHIYLILYQIQSDWCLVLFLKTLILINSLFLLTVHSRRILHMQFLSFNASMPRWSRALLVSTVDDSTSQRWPHAHSKDSKKASSQRSYNHFDFTSLSLGDVPTTTLASRGRSPTHDRLLVVTKKPWCTCSLCSVHLVNNILLSH